VDDGLLMVIIQFLSPFHHLLPIPDRESMPNSHHELNCREDGGLRQHRYYETIERTVWRKFEDLRHGRR
jgi:hypothetical protein